ncbi:MAG: asparagine--tRNA ligase [Candidatus Izimaplasma sp.]|nr:asparagine--tRNA ligase [Candidatus Izimaplasma bacterium]
MDAEVKKLLLDTKKFVDKKIKLKGWIRNNRSQKEFGFIDLNDGTAFESIQIVYEDKALENFKEVAKFNVGSAISVEGKLVLTPNMKQPFEVKAETILLKGGSLEDYPIQPKRHSREFLRENAHFRSRTNLFNAVFRVRSVVSFAIHRFFQERNFIYLHAPLITANDAEGAGELFQVSTLDSEKPEKDFFNDFFGKKTNLTVTGQLQAEAFALAFSKVYTFGPTFRAEKSNTPRHASEFWMIEPEVAFFDLKDNMELAEEMIKFIIDDLFKNCQSELEFFNKFVEKGLIEKLKNVQTKTFIRITYKKALEILKKHNEKFTIKAAEGNDLATEHEKFLTKHFGGPVFVTDWPKDLKAFYMRLNDDDETVAAMDLLVPLAGELIGGSQREERLDYLEKRMEEMNISDKDLWWYKDLRKYGGNKHSGFGLGLERMIMYVTGVDNIRDVIPFPRTPKHCEF